MYAETLAKMKGKQGAVFATGPTLWAGVVNAVEAVGEAWVDTGEAARVFGAEAVANGRRVRGDDLFQEERYPKVGPGI